MKTFVTLFLIFVAVHSHAEEVVKQFAKDDVYCIDTTSLSPGPKATWIIFKNGKYDAGPEDAAGVLEHFGKQPEGKKKNGIFIHSKTHSIPFSEEEKRWMTPYLLELYQNQKWRDSENALVKELVHACESKNIKVWVNLSSNVNGSWRLLTETKHK